jgi:hypothetical protein
MSEKDVSILDAINPMSIRVGRRDRDNRMSICRDCVHFTSLQRCNLCGCVMPLKVSLAEAFCPDGKWGRIG